MPGSNDGVPEIPAPVVPREKLKARANRWLIAAFLVSVGPGSAVAWLARPQPPQVIRLFVFVPFLVLGAAMIAIDVGLRFASARYYGTPPWTYLLFNRDVGLDSKGLHLWIVGAGFVAIGVSELVFHAFTSS
jgi:hypothetical protein